MFNHISSSCLMITVALLLRLHIQVIASISLAFDNDDILLL